MSNKAVKIKRITKEVLKTPISVYDVVNANSYHNFLILGNKGFLVSHNSCLLDE